MRSTYSPWCLQPGPPPRRSSTSEVSLLANPVNYLAYNPKIRSYAAGGSGSDNTKMSDNAYNRTASHSPSMWAIFRQVNFQSGPALLDRCKVLSPFDLLLRLVISLAFMVANEASARNGAAPNNALAPQYDLRAPECGSAHKPGVELKEVEAVCVALLSKLQDYRRNVVAARLSYEITLPTTEGLSRQVSNTNLDGIIHLYESALGGVRTQLGENPGPKLDPDAGPTYEECRGFDCPPAPLPPEWPHN